MDFRRAHDVMSENMKMIIAVLKSIQDAGLSTISPEMSMYSLYLISNSGVRGWPVTRVSREGMRR